MSAETKVYQVTYLRDGRDVLIGDEIMSLDTAARMRCPQGHPLRVIYRKDEGAAAQGAANVWWLACTPCGPQSFVRRYEVIADPRNAGTRYARLAKANAKAPAELIQGTHHHVRPFLSVEEALAAFAKERDALDGIEAALVALAALQPQEA
ncbi:MAG: hypothetical protein GXY76_17045 [Chloroflexi bacterium]|nr:hypothetical protein [Chloroflexota bacterium]